jgi:hypothetical protein
LVRGDIDYDAIHQNGLVSHQLSGLCTRRTETYTVDDVVKTRLQKLQKVLTCGSFLTSGFLIVACELALENPVDPANLLLLAQLHAVIREPAATLTMLAWRIFNLALAIQRTNTTLEEQISPFTSRQLALRA